MCCFVSILLNQTANYIDQLDDLEMQAAGKSSRRRIRLYMVGLLLISFVKFVMGAYPTLHDLNEIFFFLLMSITFVKSYVEAFYFLLAGILYAISNSAFLWVTWLKRFSGNANFFYFQVIVLNAFTVLLFIQVFMGLDGKRKKYSRQLAKNEAQKSDKKTQ
jgi:fatty acid desaturase